MGLNPKRNTISSGQALLEGRGPARRCQSSKLREIRGDEIAMIFQDPMTSLNPVHTIGKQLVEAVSCTATSRSGTRAPARSSS